jgi:membrane protein YdbS with pleckstrin-like domain
MTDLSEAEPPAGVGLQAIRRFRRILVDLDGKDTMQEQSAVYEQRPSLSFRILASIFTLGLYTFWYRRTLATLYRDRLRIERGILSRNEEEIPLTRITNVRAKLNPLPGSSKVIIGTGSGETSGLVEHLNRRAAKDFAKQINEARSSATAGPQP